jgi:hypothetical protein
MTDEKFIQKYVYWWIKGEPKIGYKQIQMFSVNFILSNKYTIFCKTSNKISKSHVILSIRVVSLKFFLKTS